MEKKMMNVGEKEKEANAMMYGAGKASVSEDLIYGACFIGALAGGLFATRAAGQVLTFSVIGLRRSLNMIKEDKDLYFTSTTLSGPWYNRWFEYTTGRKPKPKPKPAPSTSSD